MNRVFFSPNTTAAVLTLLLAAATAAIAFQISPADRKRLLGERPQRIQTAKTLLLAQRAVLGLTTDDTFEPAGSAYDELGRLHVRLHRYYKGVRVMGGDVKVGVDYSGASGRVNTRPGLFIALPSVKPAISEQEMREILARDLRASENAIAFETELVIYEAPKQTYLAWLARIDGEAVEPTRYLVDAQSGAVLVKWPGVESALMPGKTLGFSYYSGDVEIDHLFDTNENRYRLQDPTRQTKVYDMRDQKETLFWKGELYSQDPSQGSPTVWGNGQDWVLGGDTFGPPGQTAAVDAFYGARLTYDMLSNVLGRDGLDGNNGTVKLRVHYRKSKDNHYANANWDGEYANFGDGETSEQTSWTSVSIVSHELGHALWRYAVTHDNDGGERKGLNEGHGDILGAIVYHYEQLANGAGSIVPTNAPENVGLFWWRSINPWGYFGGKEYGMSAWVEGMGDKEEHVQGCAYGRMFAILAMGSPSVAEYEAGPPCEPLPGGSYAKFRCLLTMYVPQGIVGIGMDKAARIWYLATIGYFDGKPTFHEARDAYLNAATDLFGYNSDEYKSVMNAWAAINVGEQAKDTQAPTVVIDGPLLNNYEQTMVIGVSGQDDIGVDKIELFRTGVPLTTVNGGSWLGLLDLSTVPYGNYIMRAKAYDSLGKIGETEKPLPYKGANFLLQNRGFEYGSQSWETSIGDMIKSSAELAFLGSRYGELPGSNWIRQKVTAPMGITNLSLGYRVAVDKGVGSTDSAEQLKVEILSTGEALMGTINTIPATLDTTQALYRNYKQFHHPLGTSYFGQTFWLRFRSSNAKPGRFRIDNVYVVYEGMPAGDFVVEVDEAEGSVTFQLKNITGIDLSQIRQVRVGAPGDEGFKLGAQLISVRDAAEFTTNTNYKMVATIYNLVDEKVAELGPKQFTVKRVNQIVVNPGFESGPVWWEFSGAIDFMNYDPAWGQGNAAFLGNRWAKLAGKGSAQTSSLRHRVFMPANALSASLTFRLRIDTSEALANDKLRVKILDNGTSQVLATLATIGSDQKTDAPDNFNAYKRFNGFDLMPFKNNKFIIEFEAEENGSLATAFLLDNIGVTYTIP